MKSDMEVHLSFKCTHQEEWDLSSFTSAQPSNQWNSVCSETPTPFQHPFPVFSLHSHTHGTRAANPGGSTCRELRLELDPPNPAGTAAVTGKDKAVLQSPLIPQQLPKQGLTKPCTPPPCPQTQPCPAARPDWARPANPRCKLSCLGPQLN